MDRFKLGKKWFWIGIVMGLNPVFGLIYSIALLTEKDRRKEGMVVLIWTIAWAIISYNLSNWLAKEGWLPTYELKNPGKLYR
ncbi:MAG: hypothetical protein AAB514_03465 [Patescibacteria group bacterium]